MILLISLLLVAQDIPTTSGSRWASPDALIEDSLGSYVDFAVDYNYSNGNIYVACIPDSGTYFGPDYWGILLFRSTDHGETGDLILADAYSSSSYRGKGIDLVVTRSDTVYALVSWYDKGLGHDQACVAEIYEEGGGWTITWPGDNINATEIRSPKLVRDDFDDFYLYMSYLDITPDRDSLIILRSEDKGYNWSNVVRASSAAEWQDQDIAVADSSLYHLSTFQNLENQTLQFGYWRSRGISAGVINLLRVNTNYKGQIKYPRIGATTTLPDTTQLVYAFFSQENSVSGDYDLLYMYSEYGGDTFAMTPDTAPDTLIKGSSSPILCDLRGYQVAPNQWMDITYCLTSSGPNFENFWCWSSEGDPANWQGITSVGTGTNRSIPELFYSPGAPGTGAGVVYNDSLGNLWLDAPWKESGIDETSTGNKDKIRSQIVLAGSVVEVGSAGAVVYDVTGRQIRTLNTNLWDLKDGEGNEVDPGIYFIVDKYDNRLKLSVMK
jgi:hypothetical protein